MPKFRRLALQAFSAYYMASGAWPLLSRRTFEAVTGPKTDYWLVQMVALLAITNGATIAVALRKKKVRDETIALALLSAASFSLIDIVHASRGRIPKIYLADTLVEAALAAALFV